jgi:hypothetical protein
MKDLGTYVIAISAAGLLGLLTYANIWEMRQPRIKITGAVVKSISSRYYRSDIIPGHINHNITIYGTEEPIVFHSDDWDETVEEGSAVDLTMRKGFPLLKDKHYDGLTIDDHKNQ